MQGKIRITIAIFTKVFPKHQLILHVFGKIESLNVTIYRNCYIRSVDNNLQKNFRKADINHAH